MKTFLTRQVAVDEISNISCNLCGKSVEKNNMGYFDDYISLTKNWGYHSPYDGESHSIDLCQECYRGWIAQFEIPPAVEEGNFVWL